MLPVANAAVIFPSELDQCPKPKAKNNKAKDSTSHVDPVATHDVIVGRDTKQTGYVAQLISSRYDHMRPLVGDVKDTVSAALESLLVATAARIQVMGPAPETSGEKLD